MQALLTEPIAAAIAETLGCPVEAVRPLVMPPTKAGIAADYAIPCFQLARGRQLAKSRAENPAQLAALLAGELSQRLAGATAQAAGPFLNISLPPQDVASCLLPILTQDPQASLRSESGAGKTVCIDFSSPNIAKHLAFHHIRSTMIGNALARCYAACGWRSVRINFLGDWGTAFGRLIAGWKREGLSLADLDAAPERIGFLNQLYVRISKAAKEDPAVAEEARLWSKRLEDGHEEARQLWQTFKDASLAEFKKVYALLGVDFDSWKGEAWYEGRMGTVLDELDKRGLCSIDEGATVVDLSSLGFKKPCLIKRADGGTLYATRDITACDDRHQEYGFDRSLYVVDLGQSLHFREWFAVAKLLERPYVDQLRHVGFGVVLMWDEENQGWGKTASRKGVPMLLVDVLEEAITRARAIIEEKNPDLDDAEKTAVAQAVGIGAVVFNDLKNSRKGDVKFRFDDALNMQGETGPYLQFSHARLASIERRYAQATPDAAPGDPRHLDREDEKQVLLAIARLRSALERCVEEDEPSILATALMQLASRVASWLTAGNADSQARVLCPNTEQCAARLLLVRAARSALAEGLQLLGLCAPKRM